MEKVLSSRKYELNLYIKRRLIFVYLFSIAMILFEKQIYHLPGILKSNINVTRGNILYENSLWKICTHFYILMFCY
jgi:hypothetical protein